MNRKQAIHRLRIKLALSQRQPPAASRSLIWQQRVKSGRISVSFQHEEFPALLAEALDILAASEFKISTAAEQLQVTSSQLIKFLKVDSKALSLVNQERLQRGESSLR